MFINLLKKWFFRCFILTGVKDGLAKGFERGCDQIVSYIKHKITSGKIEGFNNLISRIIHRSCGISNLDYLYIRMRHDSIMRSV